MDNLKFVNSEYMFVIHRYSDIYPKVSLKYHLKEKFLQMSTLSILPAFCPSISRNTNFITALTFIYGPYTRVTTPERPDSLMFPHYSSHLI